MSSSIWYQFDADDVAAGAAYAVVSQGRRRLLLRDLLADELQHLKRLNRQRRFQREQIPAPLFASLQSRGLIRGTPRTATLGEALRACCRIPSRTVSAIAAPFQRLFSPAMLALMLLCQLMLYAGGMVHLAKMQDFAHWVTHVTLVDALITLAVIQLSGLVHEFGHAAACLRHTGATGSIRLMQYRGAPAMAADVSSICMTDARGKAMVAIAGAAIQSVFGLALLASGVEALRMGASMAVLAALFSMTPLPGTDGYWLLRDLFGLRLRPRLWRSAAGRWSDVLYGYLLSASIAGFSILLLRQCAYLLELIRADGWTPGLRTALLAALLSYLAVVTCLFVWKNLKLFVEDQEH